MQKLLFCLILSSVLLSAGCVAMDESGLDNANPDAAGSGNAQSFGPDSLAGLWTGESNWDGTVKEIVIMVRKPVVERMVSPTGPAPIKKTEPIKSKDKESGLSDLPSLTLNPDAKTKPKDKKSEKATTPPPQGPPAPTVAWEPISNTGLVFWGWDIFIKGTEKVPFFNLQIIFKETGPGQMSVVSQSGGAGQARFIRSGAERRIELDLTHPMFKGKAIKGRFLFAGDKINGSFTLWDKEGVFKLVKDNSKPDEETPPK